MMDDVLFRHKLGLFEMNSGPFGHDHRGRNKKRNALRTPLTNIMTPHVLNTSPHAASFGPQIKPRIINLCSATQESRLAAPTWVTCSVR